MTISDAVRLPGDPVGRGGRSPGWRASLRDFIRRARAKQVVLNALMVREMMSRYGHHNIGFFWLVAEPLLLTIGVMALWTALYGHQRQGLNVIPFVLTGYTMLSLFRDGVNRSMHCFRHSVELLFHRSIKPFDIFFCRQVTIQFGILIAFYAIYVPLVLFEAVQPIDDHLIFLGAYFLMCFFIFGLGLIVACLTELSDTVERFIPPIMYISIPATGAFLLVGWVSERAQHVLLYFPMIHGTEMLRAGYFGPGIPTHWDPWYLFLWGLALNSVGFAMIGQATKRLEV